MSQHDFSIANQGFPSFRSDLNDGLQALVSNSSGATAPSTTYAHQFWVDTAADPSILKVRNADNDAWITLGNIDQTGDTFIFTPAAGSASAPAYTTSGDLNTGVFFPGADRVGITTAGTQRIEVDASGNVGIGTSSPEERLTIIATNPTDGRVASLRNNGASSLTGTKLWFNQATVDNWNIGQPAGVNAFVFCNSTGSAFERMRIASSGAVLINATSSSTVGERLQVYRDGDVVASFARQQDGTIINIRTGGVDGAIHGSISISGVTCSYNSFAGSHWSQLQDGSKPDILRGTVMESIDELVEWPDEPTTESLCKVKVSDTAGSKKVYGVFMAWDEDWSATNDMMVTALGAFVCRISSNVVVQQGDLLESNGDGTARVQADDIIRSSTIGKVTSTTKTHQYDDGSYCVPTVLCCG